jgi:hypothetical protein
MNKNDNSKHNRKHRSKLSTNDYAIIVIGISTSFIGLRGILDRTIPAPYGYFIDFGELHILFGSLFIGFGLYVVIWTLKKLRSKK